MANPGRQPDTTIPEEEPVFVIRGQDLVGWAAVEAYANLALMAGADFQLVKSALEHAERMKRWAKDHGKLPDLP